MTYSLFASKVPKKKLETHKRIDNIQNWRYFIQGLVFKSSQKSQADLALEVPMKNVVTKYPFFEDWHPADIKAKKKKKGYSLARLARENGYAETSPSNVFRQPWAAMEKLIAGIIGLSPCDIWPTRYIKNDAFLRKETIAREKRRCND